MKPDEIMNLIKKLKTDKKTLVIFLIGFVGMFLVLVSDGSTEKNSGEEHNFVSNNILSESELAVQVEKLVEAIDGAGKAKVMITYKSYEETVYAHNSDESSDTSGRNEFTSEYIILDTGDKEEGMKVKIILPEIKGVAVVCQGGGNSVIKEQIISAISALFNISSNKISVAVMAK